MQMKTGGTTTARYGHLWHPENPGQGRIGLLWDVLPVPGLQPKDQPRAQSMAALFVVIT